MTLRLAVAAVVLCPLFAPAQTLRLDPPEAERETRPPQIESDEAAAIERAFNHWTGRPVLKPLDEGWGGLRLKLGRIAETSGMAVGPEFVHRTSFATVRTSARFSPSGYRLFDAELALPYLAGERSFVNVLATRRNLPTLTYYGDGPESRGTNRAEYRLEDTRYEVTAGVRPFRNFRAGATAGWLRAAGSSVPDTRSPSIFALFPANRDLTHRDYRTVGGFIEYNTTDVPGSPHSGGDYSVLFTNYAGSHDRIDLSAQQYIGFFNAQRVIALRASSALTSQTGGRSIPFYLEPALGGADTLRGYAPFRFHDRNSLVANAEYRWMISSGIEMAVFTDQGTVFPRISEVSARTWKSSYGAGVRFSVRENVFARVDLGCSREGCLLWLRFNDVF